MKKGIVLLVLAALLSAALLPATLLAQTKTLPRRYVPIIVRGSQLPIVNLEPALWRAFVFRSGQWQMVPFQADGREDGTGKYNKPWSGIIDSNDELLFMPEDLGDRAPEGSWYEDPAGRSAQRLEFEFSEPLNPAQKGWIYLYKNAQPSAGYMTHIDAPSGSAADTLVTPWYKLGHNRDGWIDYIALAGNPKIDLLDRLKLHFAGEAPSLGLAKYAAIEDTLNDGSYTAWPGQIRMLRDQRSKISIPQLFINNQSVDYQLSYFPYSMGLAVQDAQINAQYTLLAGIKTIRQSVDLAPAAAGMKFYSEFNRSGFAIDGQNDAVDTALKSQTGKQWTMASGPQGTLLLVMDTPSIQGGASKLYYRDSQAGGTADGTPESGDKKSYSDMGLWTQANAGSSLVTDRITMTFGLYMLPEKNRDALFADSLVSWVKQPLQVSLLMQNNPGSGLALEQGGPQRFALTALWPNPVRTSLGSVQGRVSVAGPVRSGQVRIYNTLGQTLRSWNMTAGAGGETTITWDLRDAAGRLVTPGHYFMQLRLDGEVQTRPVRVMQ